jgi:hypothetical protein
MKCPTNSEIFTFSTQEDRTGFLAELRRRWPAAQYATALDPDLTEDERWLVAIQVDQYDMRETIGGGA